ncbi:MAG: hypothetical protein ACYCYF_06630, partial [Anaerolineae bacterium]
MRLASWIRILLLAGMLLSVVACQPRSGTATTPDKDATEIPTAPPTMVSTTTTPEIDTTASETPVSGTPAPTLSLAEQSLARKGAITEALTKLDLPKDGDVVAT